MIKTVQIIKVNSTHVIAEYPIDLIADDLKEDYFAEAWENAVDDGLVDEFKRSNYIIQFVEDNPLNR